MSLTLTATPERGRCVLATTSLPPGAILNDLSGAPLAHVFFPQFCSGCGVASTSLLFCKGCDVYRFCSRKCQQLDWPMHKAECEGLKSLGKGVPPSVLLVGRALNVVSKGGLIFLPQVGTASLDRAALETPNGLLSLPHNYGLHSEKVKLDFSAMAPALQKLGVNCEHLKPLAILEMFGRARCSVFTIADAELRPKGLGFYPLGGAVNHSCSPNAFALWGAEKGTQQTIRTTSAIKPGEEVTISYIDASLPTHLRREELLEGYQFQCTCPRCALMAASSSSTSSATALTLIPQVLDGIGVTEGVGVEGTQPSLPPWRYQQGYTKEDEELLSLPCKACRAGAHLALFPPSTTDFTTSPLFALPCSHCSIPLTASDTLRALYGVNHRLRHQGSSLGGEKGLELGVGALVTAAKALGQHHHLLCSLSLAVAHAAVECGKFEVALWAGTQGERAIPFAFSSFTSPIPPLHWALLGKLNHLAEHSLPARHHFIAALKGLSITHGGQHPLVVDLAGRLREVEAELDAGTGTGGRRLE